MKTQYYMLQQKLAEARQLNEKLQWLLQQTHHWAARRGAVFDLDKATMSLSFWKRCTRRVRRWREVGGEHL